MRIDIAVAYVNSVIDNRLFTAQSKFIESCTKFNITPLIFVSNSPAQVDRPLFSDMLIRAREVCDKTNSKWIFWINSDCEIKKDPRDYLQENICYGFHRTEIPSMEYCEGVDMYAIHIDIWDKYLSKDIPKMYVGSTHIDWWVTRACQKHNVYKGIRDNTLYHLQHEVSSSSSPTGTSPMSIFNINNYNSWADRNGVQK